MLARSVILAWVLMLSVARGGSATTSPTPTTTTPTSPSSSATGALTGLVREYASSAGDLDPVADARVEVAEGPVAGRSAMTTGSGEYRLEELPTRNIQLRITKAGFQTLETSAQVSPSIATANLLVRRECSAWPAQILDMMSRLSMPSGLCLIRQQNGRVSNYQTQTRTVYLRMGAPVGGELGALTHELGHAHQHQAVLEAGLSEPGFDDDFIPKWVSTREGTRFVQLTGWRHDPAADQNRPPFGWTENCERWSCGYQNPVEDSAQFTSNWYNVGSVYVGQDLQRDAPNRSQWAREFLPR